MRKTRKLKDKKEIKEERDNEEGDPRKEMKKEDPRLYN
jgi:hypothetical protein